MNHLVIAARPGWLAIDKPTGVSIHNDPGHDLISLTGKLLKQDSQLASTCAWEKAFSPSAVHRLDRETSGVVLISTSTESARTLSGQFAERTVSKVYRAVLAGKTLPVHGKWEFALVDASCGRVDPAGPKSQQKDCVSLFKKIRDNEFFCEVELSPLTGRQHQLRRHATLAGHQVIGDRRYGNPKYADKIAKIYGCDRLFLHAEKLTFIDPSSSTTVLVEAKIPPDFLLLLEPK